MDRLLKDVRYTLRVLRRSPAFTLVAVLTIALGIGVNSTIFSVVNAVLLRPLPVEAPEELIDVYGRRATSENHGTLSFPNFEDYRDQATTVTDFVAYTNFFANLSVEGSSELVVGELVSDQFFQNLGIRPAVGRAFSSEEFAAPGAGPVVILSHPFWQTRFAADPSAVGRTLRLNGQTYTIVGVAPESFSGMFPAVRSQMWLPLSMVDEVEPLGNQRGGTFGDESRLEQRQSHFLWVKGRLVPGADVGQARAELTALSTRLSEAYPEANELERIVVYRTNDVAINPDFDQTLTPVSLVLLGAVGLVLLVACANLANMMLARATARKQEIAVRLALGARRGQLVRQMLTESLVLALAGGALAAALSYGLVQVVARFQPPLPINIGVDITPDWRVMVFTFLVAAGTGIVFGLVPALKASRPDLVPALKDTGDGASRGARFELRDLLVVGQVALSLVLLVAGALVVRSLGVASQVDLGYDLERTAYLGVAGEMNGLTAEETQVFVENSVQRLEAMGQVESVGLASRIPLSLNNNGFGLFIDGHQESGADRPYVMDGAYIDENYFPTLELTVLQGRGIERADREERRRVAVVTRTMAEEYWSLTEAVGREFRTAWEGTPWTIVGVVEDYKVNTPGEEPTPYLHLPMSLQSTFTNFIVRTAVPVNDQIPLMERELRAIDPDLVFLDTRSFVDLAEVRLFPIRAGAWLIGAFGVLALILAAVGLYGVIAYSVSRRQREMGIRMAMGAEGQDVLTLVLRQGMLLVGIGAVVGAILAAFGAQALRSVLFVSAFDAVSFAAAGGLLALVALFANGIPALRAARVDPMVVLRGS